ncbi:hypothetical protein ACMXYO_02425 [Neptuniibacter sp. QD37_6]|uniref:hypothetical protein n=1 Tax=Neptuniibacter sp. QD37_6 TaxID=3398210 RepID=UPI0039F5FB9D
MYDMQYDALDLIHSGMTLDQFKTMLDSIDVKIILQEELEKLILNEQQCFVPEVVDGIVVGGEYIKAA